MSIQTYGMVSIDDQTGKVTFPLEFQGDIDGALKRAQAKVLTFAMASSVEGRDSLYYLAMAIHYELAAIRGQRTIGA